MNVRLALVHRLALISLMLPDLFVLACNDERRRPGGSILPSESYWELSGNDYCARFGLACTDLSYYSSSRDCSSWAYRECWDSAPPACCQRSLRGTVSYPRDTSARWDCR
ncbi:MAG: hypothetical protein FJ125_14325 [Deltaproteobacteria bacterium]|nr:hypothetical protein [Deltaproteobacteria bacterium]